MILYDYADIPDVVSLMTLLSEIASLYEEHKTSGFWQDDQFCREALNIVRNREQELEKIFERNLN